MMSATIGTRDIDLYASPLPDLLRETTRIAPVETGTHVLLEDHGVRSMQRLAMADIGGMVVVALWPAELKAQANYLYGGGLARPMISAARGCGWTAEPSPHLAFRNSRSQLRLYMAPRLDAVEYARRWEGGDLKRVGAHNRADLRNNLWRWLKRRGYADDGDNPIFEEWLGTCLGNRPALLRAALRLKRSLPADHAGLAEKIRAEVNTILAAAGEPELNAANGSSIGKDS